LAWLDVLAVLARKSLAIHAGALKTQVLENASTENANTMQTFSQIKKSMVHFQVGWASGLQIVFI